MEMESKVNAHIDASMRLAWLIAKASAHQYLHAHGLKCDSGQLDNAVHSHVDRCWNAVVREVDQLDRHGLTQVGNEHLSIHLALAGVAAAHEVSF